MIITGRVKAVGLWTRKRDFRIGGGGIDKVEVLSIGGVEQTILFQGEDVRQPVLFFLHGGPSMPLPGVSSRGRDYTVATNTKELVKEFVVVFWDQRGTGKSYSDRIPQDSMSLRQFIRDACEIVDYLRERFGQERIYLAAHSFGTLIGLHLIHEYSQKFHSYVGLSQLVSWTENDKLSYKWAMEEAAARGNRKALRELKAVGKPPYLEGLEQWGVLRKWQLRFNSMVHSDESVKHPGLNREVVAMLRSGEYTLKDVFNTFYKGFKLVYSPAFIGELPSVNVRNSIRELQVPVTFIHGRHDRHVHGRLLEEYFGELKNGKRKRLLWAERSAHIFHPEDTKWIEQVLINEKHTVEGDGK